MYKNFQMERAVHQLANMLHEDSLKKQTTVVKILAINLAITLVIILVTK